MRPHARHVAIAVVLAIIIAVVATVAARAQDFSKYSGAQLYDRFCASCHGAGGRGDGPVAASLRVEVPDLTRITHRHGGKFPEEDVRRIIDGRKAIPAHGSRVMPVWGFEFFAQNAEWPDAGTQVEEMVRRLTEHVRSLQKPAE